MPVNVQATFTSVGGISAVMDADQGSMKLTTVGVDVNNTVKTQKSTDNGASWVDVTTYNAEQTALVITPAAGEQYRLTNPLLQAGKQIQYKLSREN